MATTSQPVRTSADLVESVLLKNGVLSVGQSVAPEDAAKVVGALDGIFRMLGALEVVYVADADQIPGEWFEALGDIIAGETASKFAADVAGLKALGMGGPPSPVPYLAGAGVLALRIMLRGRPTGEPLQTESF